jgi:acyl-CoA synthetase (AMP-forming)/AMP-acid ligase II
LRIVDNIVYYGNYGSLSSFHTVCGLIYIDIPHDGKATGEIIVRGNAVMKGYHKNPEATAGAMRGGWFHTGNAGRALGRGAARICCFKSRATATKTELRNYARDHLARAAKNSDGQGPEICTSWKAARHFQTVMTSDV